MFPISTPFFLWPDVRRPRSPSRHGFCFSWPQSGSNDCQLCWASSSHLHRNRGLHFYHTWWCCCLLQAPSGLGYLLMFCLVGASLHFITLVSSLDGSCWAESFKVSVEGEIGCHQRSMNSIPIVVLKQVPQIFVAMLTLDAFNSAAFWVAWEQLSLGTWPLSWAMGAQHKPRPILQENQNMVQYGSSGRGRKMVAELPPPLIPTDLPGLILSTVLCWIIPWGSEDGQCLRENFQSLSLLMLLQWHTVPSDALTALVWQLPWEPSPREYRIHCLNTRCHWDPKITFPCFFLFFSDGIFQLFCWKYHGFFPLWKKYMSPFLSKWFIEKHNTKILSHEQYWNITWKRTHSLQCPEACLMFVILKQPSLKASLVPAASERAIHFSEAIFSQNNDQKHIYDWTRNALLLQNCNNFSDCWDAGSSQGKGYTLIIHGITWRNQVIRRMNKF